MLTSPDGGIGRRAGLKHQWGNPSRFDPGSGYKAENQVIDFQPFIFLRGSICTQFVPIQFHLSMRKTAFKWF